MRDTDRYYKKVIESVKLLALPYEQQKTYFPEFSDIPFEILDTYDKAFSLLPSLVEEDRFSNAGIAGLLRLHILIDLTAGIPDLADLGETQFRDRPEWNKIRVLAKETLGLIGEPLEKPDPDYI